MWQTAPAQALSLLFASNRRLGHAQGVLQGRAEPPERRPATPRQAPAPASRPSPPPEAPQGRRPPPPQCQGAGLRREVGQGAAQCSLTQHSAPSPPQQHPHTPPSRTCRCGPPAQVGRPKLHQPTHLSLPLRHGVPLARHAVQRHLQPAASQRCRRLLNRRAADDCRAAMCGARHGSEAGRGSKHVRAHGSSCRASGPQRAHPTPHPCLQSPG